MSSEKKLLLDFAERIRILREEKKMSQSDLARQVQVAPAALSRILSGERPLRMELAIALAGAFSVSVTELTGGTTAEKVVSEWVPQADFKQADRARAVAERDAELARNELEGWKKESASLREELRAATTRVSTLEREAAMLRSEAAQELDLANRVEELKQSAGQLKRELARATAAAEEFKQSASKAIDQANQNYQAWLHAKNRIQVLEQDIGKVKNEKVAVAVISAALAGLAGAVLAAPAESSPSRRRS